MPSPAAIKAGRAAIELGLDSEGVRAGLEKVEDRLRRFGKQLKSIGKSMLIFGGTITAAFIPAVKAASDAQESLSRFKAVFGDQADAATKFADTLAKEIGRSSVAIKDALGTFQSFFLGLQFDPAQAREMSQQVEQLAIDFASFNNLSDEEAVQRFISALSGSAEVLDKYGVNIRQAALEQELLKSGINKSWSAVTEQEKAIARLAIILRTMSDQDALGDAIRTSGSFANMMKRLRADIEETSIAIGNALLPILSKLLSFITPLIQSFGEWVKQNQALVISLAVTGAAITLFGSLSIATAHLVGGLVLAVKTLRIALTALAKHPWLAALTAGLLIVGKLTGAFDYLGKKLDEVMGVDAGEDLNEQLKKAQEQADRLTGERFQPSQLAAAGVGNIGRATTSLFDTRLALQVFGQQGGSIEKEQLRVLKAIEKNTAEDKGIPVV